MTDEQPVVNWDALRPQASGSRTYQGPGLGTPPPWPCARCGEQNSGPIEAGCTKCGGGGGARHVGIDPIVYPKKVSEPDLTIRRVGSYVALTPARDAFLTWIEHTQDASPFAAFRAGWEAAQRMTDSGSPVEGTGFEGSQGKPVAGREQDRSDAMTVGALPATSSISTGEPESALPGTPQSRTILAALEYFVDQVLPMREEEIASGEWMTVDQVQDLIAQLKEKE